MQYSYQGPVHKSSYASVEFSWCDTSDAPLRTRGIRGRITSVVNHAGYLPRARVGERVWRVYSKIFSAPRVRINTHDANREQQQKKNEANILRMHRVSNAFNPSVHTHFFFFFFFLIKITRWLMWNSTVETLCCLLVKLTHRELMVLVCVFFWVTRASTKKKVGATSKNHPNKVRVAVLQETPPRTKRRIISLDAP